MIKNIFMLFLLFSLVSVGYAQQRTGQIRGAVTNVMTGESMPGVNVFVVDSQGETEGLGSVTDMVGEFVIDNVPVGTYGVRASFIGFLPMVKTDIVVSPVKPAVVNFALEETAIEFDEIVVTPEYFLRSPDAPLSTRSQSSEEIRRLPGGFEDVVRAISILPGVAQPQSGRNDLIIRGGAPSENLYVVENIEVSNINHFGTQGASGGPLSYINLDFVNETTFSTGGFGVKYGDRLSSVLTLDLREGRKDRFGGKATISATQFGLNLESPMGEKGSWLFSARRSYLDFIFESAGFSFVPEYWDFLAKADYQFSPGNKLTILGVGALDNIKFFNDDRDDRYDNSVVLGSDQTQMMGGVSWRHLFKDGYTTLTAGQSYVGFNYVQNDSLLNPIFRNDSYEQEFSLRNDYLFYFSDRTEISTGVQGKLVLTENDIVVPPYETSFGEIVSAEGVYDTTAYKAAVYVQATHTFGMFRFNAGLRGDYFSLLESHNAVVSPRFSATYTLTPITHINASVGRYYQAPSYVWLMVNPNNRRLKYAGTDQLILGFDHLLRSDTQISVEGYYKRYFNYATSKDRPYLVMANTGAGYGGSDEGFASFGLDDLVSESEGRAYGVEFFMQKKLSEVPCYGIVSVSYNQSYFTPLNGEEYANSFDQRWILNIGGGYLFNEKWEFATKFRLATGRPYTPYDDNGNQDPALYNSERTGINHSMDVRIDRRWIYDTFVLITYLDIQNVYNQTYDDIPYWDEREQKIAQEDNIGILPSIGISVEF